MSFRRLPPVFAYLAAAVAPFCCASAQVAVPPPPEMEIPAETTSLSPGERPPARPSPPSFATDTDDWPDKRNPFWPVDLGMPSSTSSSTNPPPEERRPDRVDWKGVTKHVRDNARVQIFGAERSRKILVAFEGRIYEIGEMLEANYNGNIYAFKLIEGAKLEPQGVRPADN